MKDKFLQILKSLGFESEGIGLSTKGIPEGLFHDWLSRPEHRDNWIDNIIKTSYDFPIWAKKLDSFNKNNLLITKSTF